MPVMFAQGDIRSSPRALTREMFAQGDIRSSPRAATREMFAQGDAPGGSRPKRQAPPALPGDSGCSGHPIGLGVIWAHVLGDAESRRSVHPQRLPSAAPAV